MRNPMDDTLLAKVQSKLKLLVCTQFWLESDRVDLVTFQYLLEGYGIRVPAKCRRALAKIVYVFRTGEVRPTVWRRARFSKREREMIRSTARHLDKVIAQSI